MNLSLSHGVFAESWKTSIVKPLVKKVGLKLIFKNYRPVSNLKFLAKLVEKCMLLQFNEHCSLNSLLPSYQSAYRKFYSCKTSLLNKELNFSETEQFFPGTQAFASPPDMASSGVWQFPKIYSITFHIHHQMWVSCKE